MNRFLDTSMLVRYLTNDAPDLATKAAIIIDGQDNLYITDVVIVEAAYVLTSVYRVPRNTVVDYMITFLQKENILTFGIDKGKALQALLLCRPSGRVSFGDAMIWAAAQSSEESIVYSLDERFPDDGLEVKSIP